MALDGLQTRADLKRFIHREVKDAPGLTPGETVRSGVENLRVIRGRVDSAGSGTILDGAGFTITRNSAGNVTLTFTTAFGGVPAVVASSNNAQTAVGSSPTTTTALVAMFDGAGVANDGIFNFIATGPRNA